MYKSDMYDQCEIILVTDTNVGLKKYGKDIIKMWDQLERDSIDQDEVVELYEEDKTTINDLENIIKKGGMFYILKHPKGIIGFISMGDDNGMKGVNLNHFYIDKNYRNKSIGSRFLGDILDKVRVHFPDAKNITTGVLYNNPIAKNMYIRNRFRPYHISLIKTI